MTLAMVFAGMSIVILTALGFEHIGGYVPCKLCLGQRVPYYTAIPISALGLTAALVRARPMVIRGLLTVVGLLMVCAVVLGVHHAGVEWAWWEGPTDCAAGGASIVTDVDNLFESLAIEKPPSCNEAAARFLGLSFAGWNVVAATGLAAFAFFGSFKRD